MKRRILLVVLSVMLLMAVTLNVSASNTIDLDRTGSITIRAVDNGKPLKDLKLTCIHIAKLQVVKGQYEYIRFYDGMELTGDIYSEDLAQRLHVFVTDNSSNYKFSKLEVRADKDGTVVFENRAPGLYLIIQEENYTLDGVKYDRLSPFVVTIPYNGTYDVDATTKPSLDVIPTDPPPTTEPPPHLPQTGQLNWPIPVMASVGIVLFVLGWILCSRTRKDAYEE